MRHASVAARTGLLIIALAVGACTATRTQQSAGEVVDDSVLTAKVKTALIDDPVAKANDVNVETYRGVVQLGGFVETAEQKARAGEVARGVSGVKEVRNDLRVSSDQATVGQVVDDSALTAAVKGKLIADQTMQSYKVNVETQNGIVQLTGFVDSSDAKNRASEVARSVDGVKDVRNDLEVRQR
jgi:hyperosmotically inducible periplasmic protein